MRVWVSLLSRCFVFVLVFVSVPVDRSQVVDVYISGLAFVLDALFNYLEHAYIICFNSPGRFS